MQLRVSTCSERGQAPRLPSGTSRTSQTPRSLRSHQARRGQATQHTGDGSLCVLPQSVEDVASVSHQSSEPCRGHQPGWPYPQCPLVLLWPALLWSSQFPLSSHSPKTSLLPQRHCFLDLFDLQSFGIMSSRLIPHWHLPKMSFFEAEHYYIARPILFTHTPLRDRPQGRLSLLAPVNGRAPYMGHWLSANQVTLQ